MFTSVFVTFVTPVSFHTNTLTEHCEHLLKLIMYNLGPIMSNKITELELFHIENRLGVTLKSSKTVSVSSESQILFRGQEEEEFIFPPILNISCPLLQSQMTVTDT